MDKSLFKIGLAALAVWMLAETVHAQSPVPEGYGCNNGQCYDPLLKCESKTVGAVTYSSCVCRWGKLNKDWSPLTFGLATNANLEEGSSVCKIVRSLGSSNKKGALAAFIGFLVNIITAMVVMAAVIVIVWGGYLYMTAGGSADRVQKAKTWIIAALLGILIALAAWVILYTINPATVL